MRISFLHVSPFVFALVAALGCGSTTRSPSVAESKASRAATQIERGPVKVSVELGPTPIHLSDEPKLVVTIDYEIGVEIQKPPFGEAVGDFVVRDFHEPLPEVHANREVLRQEYVLEPLASGSAHVDPITIHFTDKRPSGDGKQHQLETEALVVDVLSVIKDSPTLNMLKGYEEPQLVPEDHQMWPWLVGGCSLAVCAMGLVWYWRRRGRPALVPVLTPREQANIELDALRRSGAEADDIKRFYVELTAIVRRYIERTTGIQAPEQTTEEFLREIGRGSAFQNDERQRLKNFLEAADLVKFAAHLPLPEDIDESYRRARAFVGLDAERAT